MFYKKDRERENKNKFQLVVKYSKLLYPKSKSLFHLIIEGIPSLPAPTIPEHATVVLTS